jgi:Protein export membrane protein
MAPDPRQCARRDERFQRVSTVEIKGEQALATFFQHQRKLAVTTVLAVVAQLVEPDAMFLDLTKTVGFFALTGFEFNLASIAAILTIMGFSINDKIVVYDHVRENLTRFKKMPLAELIDLSINETLTRTIGTSVALFLAIVPLALFGGPAPARVCRRPTVRPGAGDQLLHILLNLGEKRLTGRRIAEVVRSYLRGTAGRRKQPGGRHSSRRAASNTPTDAESANRSVNGRGSRAEVQQMSKVLGYLSRLPASPALSRLFRHSTSDW